MTSSSLKISICVGTIAALLLSGCRSKSQVVRADDYSSETIVDLMKDESPTIRHKDHLGAKHVDKHGNAIVAHTPVDGEWIIMSAADKKIRQDDNMPYVIFSDVDGRFYANNGCNVLNGDFAYDQANASLTFSNVVTSMAECPDVTYQQDINVVLNDGVTVKISIEEKGRESYMQFKSAAGDMLMSLRKNNMEVLNGQWDVAEIDGKKINVEGVNIFLDLPELSIHGNTGCNYFNGKIEVDPFTASSISFTSMGVTMRLCENAEIERRMLVALEQVTGYRLKDRNTLILVDSSGKTLLTLNRDTNF